MELVFNGVKPWTDDEQGIVTLPLQNPSGDWTPYSSGKEDQYQPFLETDNCTGFSFTRVIEAQMNKKIAENAYGAATMAFLRDNGYVNAEGKVEFSERALGAMAGTDANGNNFPAVFAAASELGLLPNSKWFWDYSKERTYATYYAQPGPDLYALAKEFLTHFGLERAYCSKDQIDEGLTVSPLWIAIPVCHPWGSFVQYDGASRTMQHAVNIDKHDASGYTIEDDYNPYSKTLSPDYFIPAIWNVVIWAKESSMNQDVEVINYNGKVGAFVPLATEVPEEVAAFNRIFNINIQIYADGSIPNAKPVKDA